MAISLHTISLKHRRSPADNLSNIIKQNAGLVYSVCYRELRDHTLAEDAAQEVFVILTRKISRLHTGPSLSAWLFLTARNVSRTIARNEQHRRSYEIPSDDNLTTNDKTWQPIDTCLNEAISRLNTKDREVILMRFFEQYSHKEIGDLLRISESAAERRTARALERLRRIIEAHRIPISISILTVLLEKYGTIRVPEACIQRLANLSISSTATPPLMTATGWLLSLGLLALLVFASPMNSEYNKKLLLSTLGAFSGITPVQVHQIPATVNVKEITVKPKDLIHLPIKYDSLNEYLATQLDDIAPIFQVEKGVLYVYTVSGNQDYYAAINTYQQVKNKEGLTAPLWGKLTNALIPHFQKKPFSFNQNKRVFTLISTRYSVMLNDESRNVIWSLQYPQPDYILRIDKQRKAVITDNDGTIIWRGSLLPSQTGIPHGDETASSITYRVPGYGLEYNTDRRHTIVLKDLVGNIIWSGSGIHNGGLEVFSPELTGSSIWGIPSNKLLQKTTMLEFIIENGRADITDWHAKQIGSIPAYITHCNATTDGQIDYSLSHSVINDEIEPIYPPAIVGASIHLTYYGNNNRYIGDVKEQCVEKSELLDSNKVSYMSVDHFSTSEKFKISDKQIDTVEQ